MICVKKALKSGVRLRFGVSALAVVLLGSLTACGAASVSFKPGVQGEAMGIDERACRAETESDDGYRVCMADRGYVIVDGANVRTSESGRGGE